MWTILIIRYVAYTAVYRIVYTTMYMAVYKPYTRS